MCGRMNITDNEGIRFLMDLVGMPFWPSAGPRFNVSPSQSLDVLVRATDDGDDADENTVVSSYQHREMTWGMVPPWARDGQFKRPLINARSETVREKPSFRHLIGPNRCLVPVTGFYEWQRTGGSKRPYYIYPAEGRAMLFGALYQMVDEKMQVTLLTTAANDAMSAVHHRMPVIIGNEDVDTWLGLAKSSAGNPANQQDNQETVDRLMAPVHDTWLTMHEVSSYVSNARNLGPECSEPLRESGQQGLEF